MAEDKKFESLQLKPNILKGMTAMGYDSPNQVQDTLLPLLCADPPANVIMNSHVDQNKVVPFIIAMLERIDSSQNFPQALCISSTHKMAKEIIEIGSKIAQYSSIEFEYVDISVSEARDLDKHIIVVAPDQLNKLISDELCNFANINVLMLIDTDEMFTVETQRRCRIIGNKLSETCQRFYISPAVAEFARPIARSPLIFDFLQVPGSMDNIVQFYVRCRDRHEKYQIIWNNFHLLGQQLEQAIIYCQKHETANWLAEKMKPVKDYVAFYSDEISVEEQVKGLKKAERHMTITTDALSPYFRFLYIPFVVNFDIPVNQKGEADFDTYFSRISRMGRFGPGIVINLVDSEQSMEACWAIEKHFGKTIYSIDDEDLKDFEIIDINSKSADDIVVSFFQKIYCRNDPFMPLWSTKTFEELNIRPDIYKEHLNSNTSRPTKFLEATATALCEDPERNLIAQGQAGTGKTTAMSFVMMNRIDNSKEYPQVLCLVPKVEGANETKWTANRAAFNARIWWYDAMHYSGRDRDIHEQVIIGTPERLIDMMNGNAFDTDKISLLVLDDADHIISTPNLWNDCKYISEKLSPKCQIMLFSTAYSAQTMKNALNFVNDPILINLPRELELPKNVTQYYMTYSNLEEKYQALLKLFKAMFIFQGIIFCNTKETAIWLEKRLLDDGQSYMAVISDDTSNRDRLNILLGFYELNVLITSSSLHDITFSKNPITVNFDMPINQFGGVEYRTYLQRISRTARFGRSGVAVNMIDENYDHEVLACRAIEQHFGKKLNYLNF